MNSGRELLMIVKSGSVIRSGPLTSPSARPRSHSNPPTRPLEKAGVATFLQEIAARRWSQIGFAEKFPGNVAVMAQNRRRAATVLPFPIWLPDFITTHQSPRMASKRMFFFKGLPRQQLFA